MNSRVKRLLSVWLLLCGVSAVAAEQGEVQGVFGLAPVPESAALAVWVPLTEGQAVQGVRWFNNDHSAPFPVVLVVAGDANRPELIADAVVVGTWVAGESYGWSEIQFPQPLASQTAGLYVVFRLAEGSDFTSAGAGGGAGVGYRAGDGVNRCWIATGESMWNPLTGRVQMAVDAVMGGEKSGNVLVLGRDGSANSDAQPREAPVIAAVASLTAAPNPFNPQTEIRFILPAETEVNLAIFDVRGREVRSLLTGSQGVGEHAIIWDGRDGAGRAQPSGVYLARLIAGSLRVTKQLTLVQ